MQRLDRLNDRLPNGTKLGAGTFYVFSGNPPNIMQRIAEWRHIDRWHDTGVAVFITMMLAATGVLGHAAITTALNPPEPTAAQNPLNLIAIPSLNDFLPWSAGLFILAALVVAAAVHEGAHGIAMLAEDIDIEEIGIGLLLGIPIAAYVKPNESAFEAASPRARARVLSAGAVANLLVFLVTSAAFLLPGTGDPVAAFEVYFGAASGGTLPTAADVAALSAVTNTLFWTWFFNINLAFVNVLPAAILDGGRVAGIAGEVVDVPRIKQEWASKSVVAVSTSVTLAAFVATVFGPRLF